MHEHLVNFSGGLVSFWAADRVVKRYGKDKVTLLFADVNMECPDLYRFLSDVSSYLGVPITRISLEKSPWDLFQEKAMVGNSRYPICSVILKRELLDAWRQANCLELTTTLHIGVDWTEHHRLDDIRKTLHTWKVEAPMCEPPYWTKDQMEQELQKIGIELPLLYKLDFPHNNCGGFCVKAGHAHFAHLLKTLPERYAFHEQKEAETIAIIRERRPEANHFTVLTDRRGGVKTPLTLADFRRRVEGDDFDHNDWGGCGCALDANQPENHVVA